MADIRTWKTIADIVIIIVLLTCWIVLIINTSNYNKIKNNEPISRSSADTLYFFNLIITLLLTIIVIYYFYVIYKDFFPGNVQKLKYQAAAYALSTPTQTIPGYGPTPQQLAQYSAQYSNPQG